MEIEWEWNPSILKVMYYYLWSSRKFEKFHQDGSQLAFIIYMIFVFVNDAPDLADLKWYFYWCFILNDIYYPSPHILFQIFSYFVASFQIIDPASRMFPKSGFYISVGRKPVMLLWFFWAADLNFWLLMDRQKKKWTLSLLRESFELRFWAPWTRCPAVLPERKRK